MLARVGAPTSENVSVWVGMSVSLAVAVNVYAESSGIVALVGTFAITGAVFTSVTVIEIGASVFATPSVARTENAYVPGPWASVGVHENAPVFASMLAPVGAPTSEKLRLWAGMSLSVAVAVNVYAESSGVVGVAGTVAARRGVV